MNNLVWFLKNSENKIYKIVETSESAMALLHEYIHKYEIYDVEVDVRTADEFIDIVVDLITENVNRKEVLL